MNKFKFKNIIIIGLLFITLMACNKLNSKSEDKGILNISFNGYKVGDTFINKGFKNLPLIKESDNFYRAKLVGENLISFIIRTTSDNKICAIYYDIETNNLSGFQKQFEEDQKIKFEGNAIYGGAVCQKGNIFAELSIVNTNLCSYTDNVGVITFIIYDKIASEFLQKKQRTEY